jgi:hypothetical protein
VQARQPAGISNGRDTSPVDLAPRSVTTLCDAGR